MECFLVIDHLHKRHPEQANLFSEVTSSVSRHDRIALIGASGQGKSTLLRCLARLEQVDGGSLTLKRIPADKWSPVEWRTCICYVPQMPVMLPVSVDDNLRTPSRLHQGSFDKPLAKSLMQMVGLEEMDWSKKASELSGAEKQRVQLVRSLLLRSPFLLLDEITSSLDSQSKHSVENTLKHWNEKEGVGYIWVTHDLEQAKNVSERTWFLANHALLEDVRTEDFFSHPSTPEASRFLQTISADNGGAECPQ